jgi:acylphosphatase
VGRQPLTRAVRLVVHGRVQGVGFRWFVREAARQAGLAGWVRNNPDGSVELVAAGDAEALESLRRAVEAGPPGATVTGVAASPAAVAEPLPHPFTVLR